MTLRVGACLSLTGAYAEFGRQAASGLRAWHLLRDDVDLDIEDDLSRPEGLRRGLPRLAPGHHVLLGPYSTSLTRTAGTLAAELGVLLWNHGGAGDDVQAMAPGHVVSVLTPAGRYGESFVRDVAARSDPAPLWVVSGRGSFGRQVAAGAEACGRRLGLQVARTTGAEWPPAMETATWDVMCAGSFEEDVALVTRLREMETPPRHVWAVAAGVRRFGSAVPDPTGVYGTAQWIPGLARNPRLGPPEADFLAAYRQVTGGPPDYPAAQAAAAAALATHCVEVAGTVAAPAVWSVAAGLDTGTFFGRFEIDPLSGAQAGHEMALVRWSEGEPRLA